MIKMNRSLMRLSWVLLPLVVAACGGGGDGPAIASSAQTLKVESVESLLVGSTVSIRAESSAGLTVTYVSETTAVCEVDDHGLVKARAAGVCKITVNQMGNDRYSPAPSVTRVLQVFNDPQQVLSFVGQPELTFLGSATVKAQATSGLPVTYSSLTEAVCSVDPESGRVTSLAAGDCTIAVNQPGNSNYLPAVQITQTLATILPDGQTVPGMPSGVTVTASDEPGRVRVNVASTVSGGLAISHYAIRSGGGALLAQVATLPADISCQGSCKGLSFTVSATNALGEGPPSPLTHNLTQYQITQKFLEPDTAPCHTIFRGTFVYDATTGVVSALRGTLTESMTGDAKLCEADESSMVHLNLTHQLATWRDDTLGGVFAATFKNTNTNTFWTATGGDGWTPAAGVDVGGVYYGFKSKSPAIANPGNAYVLVLVPDEPLSKLDQAQIDRLAYADCAPGGMMGAVCMTGTTMYYGAIGTMSGYPISQDIRKIGAPD